MRGQLVEWLAQLDEAQLAQLLQRRPDGLIEPLPRDLGELAERLSQPSSVAVGLSRMPRPALQVAEALVLLGARATLDQLTRLLDPAQSRNPHDHETNVARQVGDLIDAGVTWPSGDGHLAVPPALPALFPGHSLGPSLEQLVPTLTVDKLRPMVKLLGLPLEGNKAHLVELLVTHLSEEANVWNLLAKAPEPVRNRLLDLATLESADQDDTSYWRDVQTAEWAMARGLLFGSNWVYTWQMPAEVTLALASQAMQMPFSPVEPQPLLSAAPADSVAREAAAAVSSFTDACVGLLDHLARHPAPALKSGGLGVRELTRLARLVSADDRTVRLALELADAAGLLEVAGSVCVSPSFQRWRSWSPGERYAVLLRRWWTVLGTPTESRDELAKTTAALRGTSSCFDCAAGRQHLIRQVTLLPHGYGAAASSVIQAVQWRYPLLHTVAEADRSLELTWEEAQILGVLAHGAASELAAVLIAGADAAPLAAAAARLLPASAETVSIGADLTAVAVGQASARVSAILDLCADREGRGGATVWRLTTGSVRRAMDEGATRDGLLTDLESIAEATLPQPLRYLIDDVARRHGALRLSPAVSLVRSDDAALLTEACADRRLRRLGLRLVGPTVASCAVPIAEALVALRGAGYLPMPEAEAAFASVETAAVAGGRRVRRPRGGRPGEPVEVADLADLVGAFDDVDGSLDDNLDDDDLDDAQDVAGDLTLIHATGTNEDYAAAAAAVARELVGKRPTSRQEQTSLEQQLQRHSRSLTAGQIRMLAHAVETGGSVLIQYEANSGAITTRIISQIEAVGEALYAWCALRNDERVFLVKRIRSVQPVP